jgi:hypothetical protein
MHRTDHSRFKHSHDFVHDFSKGERRTRIVIAITGVMMVVEISAGLLSHSMALLADGWHMSTHVAAFIILRDGTRPMRSSVLAPRKSACLAASRARLCSQWLHSLWLANRCIAFLRRWQFILMRRLASLALLSP